MQRGKEEVRKWGRGEEAKEESQEISVSL